MPIKFGEAKRYLGFGALEDDLLAEAKKKYPPPPPPTPPTSGLPGQQAAGGSRSPNYISSGMPFVDQYPVLPGSQPQTSDRLPPIQYEGQTAILNGLFWVVKKDRYGDLNWDVQGYAPKEAKATLREFNERLYRVEPNGTITDVTPQNAISVKKVKNREDTYVVKHEDGSVEEVTYAVDKNGFFQTDETGSPIVTRKIQTTPPKPEKDKKVRPPVINYPNPYGMGAPDIQIEPEWDDKSKTWTYDYVTARKQAQSDIKQVDTRAQESWGRSRQAALDQIAATKAKESQAEAERSTIEATRKANLLDFMALVNQGYTPNTNPFVKPNFEQTPVNLPGLPGGKVASYRAALEAGAGQKDIEELFGIKLSPGQTATPTIQLPKVMSPDDPFKQYAGRNVGAGNELYNRLRQSGYSPFFTPESEPLMRQLTPNLWGERKDSPLLPGGAYGGTGAREGVTLTGDQQNQIRLNQQTMARQAQEAAGISGQYPLAAIQEYERKAKLPGFNAQEETARVDTAKSALLQQVEMDEEERRRRAYLKSPFYAQEKAAAQRRRPFRQR